MGLYDSLIITHDLARCPAGHDLSQNEWQTKDLGEGMVSYVLDEAGELKPASDDQKAWGTPDYPPQGTVDVYTNCGECPVWVQKGTGNVIPTDVEYELTFKGTLLSGYRRTSGTSEEQLEELRRNDWFEGAVGPLSYREASDLSHAYQAYVHANPDHEARHYWVATCAKHGVNPDEWRAWHEAQRAKFLAELRK